MALAKRVAAFLMSCMAYGGSSAVNLGNTISYAAKSLGLGLAAITRASNGCKPWARQEFSTSKFNLRCCIFGLGNSVMLCIRILSLLNK